MERPGLLYAPHDVHCIGQRLFITAISGGPGKTGLVYSTYAMSDHRSDHGDFAVFGGMTGGNLPTFLDVVCDLIARADVVITEREVERARNAMLV